MPSPKDAAVADDVLTHRRRLLAAPQVNVRFRQLAQLRPDGPLHSWEPRQGLAYFLAVDRLKVDLDRAWCAAEIDAIAQKWATYSQELAEGLATVGLGLSCGRDGYGRREKETTIARAARSTALRAGGVSASEADQRVADEVNRGRKMSGEPGWMTPSTIAGYRKRLRDRLE
jgi:hypothetical protein